MMIGYPALMNSSPSTQQAFAQQQPTALDYYNFNPTINSALLIAPAPIFPNIDPFYQWVQEYQESLVDKVLPPAYAVGTTFTNLGTLGSTQDAEYWKDVPQGTPDGGTQGNFPINSTGLIGQAVTQDGTGTAGDPDEIRLGNFTNRSEWNFLHNVVGSNITSINFWINGDVAGAPNYPILTSTCTSAICSIPADEEAGINVFTEGSVIFMRISQNDGTTHLVDSFGRSGGTPPDDGAWHMISIVYDKGATSNWAKFCTDNVCTIDTGAPQFGFLTGTDISDQPLTIGSRDVKLGSSMTENPFNVDEVAIWHGYDITSDMTTLYNSGAGADASGIGASFLKGYWTFENVTLAPTGLSAVQQFNPNKVNLDWDDNVPAPTLYNVFKGFTSTADNTEEANTNSTWQFREQEINADNTFAPLCSFNPSGSGSTGSMTMGSTGSNNLSDCYIWKAFPRDFLNGTRIQFQYEFSNSIDTNLMNTFVTIQDEPFITDRNDESQWAQSTKKNWGASPDIGNIDTQTLTLNGGVINDDLVDVEGNWVTTDSDYSTIVFDLTDTRILSQQTLFKLFWINITDFDTGIPVGFYNFSGSSRVFETQDAGCTPDCDRGTVNVGTIQLFDTFEQIGTSVTSDFMDTDPNENTEIFYKVNADGGDNSTELAFTFISQLSSTMNLALTHDNIDMEIDLDWDDVAGADNYTVQRLSTERTITTVDNIQGDNNFGSGSSSNRPTGDNAGLPEGTIGVEVTLKSARFSNLPKSEMIGGIWYNVTTGDPNGNRKPDSTSEVEFAGFMASGGSRLSRDCNGTLGFTSLVEQDGYTQRSDGTWFDGACVIEHRFLGNQLVNSTGQNNEIGAMWLNGSSGITLIKEGIGSGFTFSTGGNSPTGTWNTLSGNIELRVLKLNQTWIDLATTLTSDYIDTTTNNYNTYFYRIIANDAGGEGLASDIVNGTLSVRPQRVPDLNGTDNGSTVDLIWQEAPIKFSRALSEDPVQGYLIQRALSNETTIYDGLAFDTEEFMWKSVDSIVTLATGQGSGSGSSPSFGSNVANGGQILNITQATNITRMVVKVGVNDGQSFNTEPDLAGGIWYENGTAITRSIFPRVMNFGDMFEWSDNKLDHEGFINWAFSPPVQLEAGEYIFGWSSLNSQTCNSASCGLGNADVGDYEVFFEFTDNGDADGYGVVGHGAIFPPTASSQPINNTKTTDYAMAIFAEPTWETIGTNLGVSNTTFTDNSPPIGVTKAYRVLSFNDAGISHPPTLVHNPQDVFIRQMRNTTDFFFVDVNNELMGLNIGELVTFAVAVAGSTPDQVTNVVGVPTGAGNILTWDEPSESPTGYLIERAIGQSAFSVLVADTGTTLLTFTDSSVDPLTQYRYQISGINSVGTGVASFPVSVTTIGVPTIVLDLDGNAVSINIQIFWTAVDDEATGYQIERKVGTGAFFTLIADTGDNSTTFTDTTVTAGDTFSYKVIGLNIFGSSPESNTATIMALNPPSMPTLTAVQNINEIDLSWTEPTSANPINGYKIDRRINGGALSVLVANTSSTLLTFTDSTPTTGNTFGYRVRALSISGEGIVSNIVDVSFGSHVTVLVKEQDGSGFKGGGFMKISNDTVVAGGGGGATGFTNAGTLGSAGNAFYTEAGLASEFVTTTGIINQGVIKNGTSSLDTDGEIIIGIDPDTWKFLHAGNVGSNITSINFWIKGDVIGSPVYPLLTTGGCDNANSLSPSFALCTQSGTNMRFSLLEASGFGGTVFGFNTIGSVPPDDSNWHMVSFMMDQGNRTGDFVVLCIDAVCDPQVDAMSPPFEDVTSGGNSPATNMTIGGGAPFGNSVTQNTFDFDDLTIWQGYQLVQSDLDTMYNSGSGATGASIQSGSQVVHLSFDSGTEIGGGGGGGGGTDFEQTLPLDSTSQVTFDNLSAGNYNFTFIDSDGFILNKTINFPFPSPNISSQFDISALVFDVDCPSNGGGTDVRIKSNYTNLQDISSYPSIPVCDSSDKLSWSVTWTGDAGTDSSRVIADFISAKFKTNADSFLVSAIPTTTSYTSVINRIMSDPFAVTTASDTTINFDLFLGEAPPAGGGSPPSLGGGGTGGDTSIPSQKIIFELRLSGLTLLSLTHGFILPNDIIDGSVVVGWDGERKMSVKRITVGEDFTNLLRFDQKAPFALDIKVDGTGETARSEAEIGYKIFIPPVFCDEDQGITQNCFEREIITIPVGFVFEFEGVEYAGGTEIVLDNRAPVFDIVQAQVIVFALIGVFAVLFASQIRKRIGKSGKTNKQKSRTRQKLNRRK